MLKRSVIKVVENEHRLNIYKVAVEKNDYS